MNPNLTRRLPIILSTHAGAGHGDEGIRRLETLFAAYGIEAEIHRADSGEEIIAATHRALASISAPHPGLLPKGEKGLTGK